MPINRNALIRFRTIDNCLQNRQRRWTLDDLIDACSEALYEYEGIDKGVSRRSVQMDIQMMRSDKLGYNAPIVVLEKKYYTYEDSNYSITNIPLTDQDLGKLTEVVEILRQFKGFSHFQELSGMVQRLENKIHSAKTNQKPVIDFEKNEDLKGLEHIDTLYQAIVKKCAVQLSYQSFKARSANSFYFHPYYLKEYRNRWFVIGVKKKSTPILTLALDRIQEITPCDAKYVSNSGFSLQEYLNDVIGVTVNLNAPAEKVLLFADAEAAPYIRTKPFHHSQDIVEALPHGTIFSLNVQLNFELEREILGFGERVKVIAPERLKRRITQVLGQAFDQYNYDYSKAAFHNNIQKLNDRGFVILNHVFGKKEVDQIKQKIADYFKRTNSDNAYAIRNLFGEIPDLISLVLNQNIKQIVRKVNQSYFLTKAIFFDKTPESNWYVTWHQDIIINTKRRAETEGFTGWTKKFGVHGVCPPEEILRDTLTIRIHLDDADETNGALKVVAGSHNKKLSDSEIALITQNVNAQTCNVHACGVQLMKPLLLHASSKATSQKSRRVIHLEFNSIELPNELEWAERIDLTK